MLSYYQFIIIILRVLHQVVFTRSKRSDSDIIDEMFFLSSPRSVCTEGEELHRPRGW